MPYKDPAAKAAWRQQNREKQRAVAARRPTTVPLSELAQALALTDRRVRQLADLGVIPAQLRGRWQLIGSVQAYIRYLRRSSTDGTEADTLEFARRRKVSAEAELAEMELGQLRGTLVTTDDALKRFAAVLEQLRARLLNSPGKYAPQFLGIRTIPEAQLRLEAMIAEAMAELTTLLDEEEDVPADDLASGGDGAAA